VLSHGSAPHELLRDFLGEQPLGREQTLVVTPPRHSVEAIGISTHIASL